jgi:hypothetical protein
MRAYLAAVQAYLAAVKRMVALAHARGQTPLGKVREGFLVGAERGQGTNLVGLFIGIMVAAIVGVQVAIPVVQDAISNLSGTEATVAGLIPLFIVLLLLIALASPLMRRL